MSAPEPPPEAPKHINVVEGLSAFTFTNEFGQAVNFKQYQGQAIGLTFFFTRFPLPDFCPRLSKNFSSATKKLEALPNGPTNWHFFSISFDTAADTPEVLRKYAHLYDYESNRWTFLTAPPETIRDVTGSTTSWTATRSRTSSSPWSSTRMVLRRWPDPLAGRFG